MFSLIDIGRVLLAVAACGLVLVLPGQALARAFAQGDEERSDLLSGVVFGLALLPLIDSFATRLIGLDAALAVTLALAIVAVVTGRQSWARPTPLALALGLAWLAVVVIQWIDLDIGGKLFQPLTVVDTVKHAATTQAIVDGGAPPRDAFFLRPQSASYYYFFYSLTALVERAGCGLIDARAAVGGTVFWVGIGLFGLVRFAKRRAGLGSQSRGETILILCVLAAGGLDCLAVLIFGVAGNVWFSDPMIWNEQITNWLESVLWVPHHVTGLIAAVLGLAALAVEADETPTHRPARAILLAGMCFASSFGLSIWVTFALVTTVAVCGLALMWERRWRMIGLVAAAGVLALCLALPQLIDLHTGRSPDDALPIAFTIRTFRPIDMMGLDAGSLLIARFVLLPVNYFVGFGALALGALLYWTTRGGARQNAFGRVLAISAVIGLILGAFLRSTIFNNDLGWRVLLFPLLAGVIWTAAAIERFRARAETPMPLWRTAPPILGALVCLGWMTSLYAFVSLRAYPWFASDDIYKFVSEAPATEHALRVAYGWADAHLPHNAVLQHNPTRPRTFAFALYGRNRTSVSDQYGGLYGADRTQVAVRIKTITPVFATTMSPDTVRAIAQSAGIDDLVVTDRDPVWSKPDAFVWHVTPLYASDRVRIIATQSLGGAVADAR